MWDNYTQLNEADPMRIERNIRASWNIRVRKIRAWKHMGIVEYHKYFFSLLCRIWWLCFFVRIRFCSMQPRTIVIPTGRGLSCCSSVHVSSSTVTRCACNCYRVRLAVQRRPCWPRHLFRARRVDSWMLERCTSAFSLFTCYLQLLCVFLY
jgi:hypothetical protein